MKTQHVDGVLETAYNPEDIERTYHEPIDTDDDLPNYSKSVMVQYRRAKRASMKNDLRSKKIVKKLNKERKKMNKNKNKITKPAPKRRQKNILDY